jgi:hypothetical protein
MSASNQPTKTQLLKIIDELKENPHDKGRILGDLGITAVGLGLGAAAAGTLASAAGVTSVWGLTSVAGWLGVTAVSATPVGWIIGVAVAGGAVAYGVSRMIHDGGLSEGRKSELLQKYKEDAQNIDAKEKSGDITDKDRTAFIISLRELIDKDAMTPDKAIKLIEQVEQGRIPLSQAFALVQAILREQN